MIRQAHFNGRRIALRQLQGQTHVVQWLHGDHLGSASLTTNTSGAIVAQVRYKPWGETRYATGSLLTDRKWTGQRSEEATLGSLYDFNARFDSYIELGGGGRMYSPLDQAWVVDA